MAILFNGFHRSRMPIKLEAWHEVRLTHNRGTGQLTVDEEDPVTGRAPVRLKCIFEV